MAQGTLRIVAAIGAFVVATIAGVLLLGTFDAPPDADSGINLAGAESFALILAVALALAFVVYAGLEYAQTGRLESISRQLDTRTIVLIPIAIAFNIILGQAVSSAIKLPIYMDSIGTILVGALAGPIPGALTGLLSNLLWTYVVPPPFHSDIAGAFAVVAVAIGLLAGAFGRFGWLRPRPDSSGQRLIVGGFLAVGLIVAMTVLAYFGYRQILGDASFAPESDQTLFLILGWLALILVAGALVGLLFLLFLRRDLTAAYVVVAGVVTGLVAAVLSAPISANLFGGVTGSGTDFLVAAFRQAGADIGASTLGQGLISDPIDKVTTFFVVYLILNAMARRTKARFPQGERLLDRRATGGAAT